MADLRDQLQTSLGPGYILGRELGGGGMSRVFVAEDTSLGRKVVVKVLLPELAAGVNVERFRREIQLAARLQHPHIVPVHSAGVSDGLPYYTMPFIEGESLRARLARTGALPVPDAVRVVRDVLSALSYAHEHGVVHRDIKPENILLTGDHAMVADFGVAKALSESTYSHSSLTSVGMVLGTPAYMAPEQAAADPATDHRADIYATGALAYEMLTGQPVFSTRSPQAMLAAHAVEKPEPIDRRRPSVPPALSALIARSLEKNAADRPQSAAEMLAQLEAAVTPSGGTTPHIGTIAPRVKEKSDRRGIFMAVASAIVLLLLGSSSWYWYTNKTPVPGAVVADTIPSIVVLPFDNLGKRDDAYFAEGMTDEISTRLGGLQGLRVIGRQSAKSYANTSKPPALIGKELGVAYLLTGTVRWDHSQSGQSRVRISPALLRASDGSQIWTEAYQDQVRDVFDIQGKVAERVAQALEVKLSQSEKQALTFRPTTNPEAYDAYLRGKSVGADTWRPTDYLRGVALLERAVKLDPKFAAAYAALGMAHLNVFWFRGDNSPRRLQLAKAAIDTALAIDPKLLAVRVALADYYYHGKLDYPRALAALAEAQRLSPNSVEVLFERGIIERRQGRMAEAVSDFTRGTQLDPRNVALLTALCETLVMSRRYDDAERKCKDAIAIAPEKWLPYSFLNMVQLLRSGDVRAALATLKQAQRRVGPDEFRDGLISSTFPAVLDPALVREIESAELPREASGVPAYLFCQLMLTIYKKDSVRANRLADSLIAATKGAFRGTFVDSELHAYTGLAYAWKGDKARALEEARLSMKTLPLSADIFRGTANLEINARSAVVAGAYDEAIADLKQLLAVPSNISAALLRVDPWFDPLRGDARFKSLVAGNVR